MALRNNSIVNLIFAGKDRVTRVVNGISGRLQGLAATAKSTGAAVTAALAGIGLGKFFKGAIGSAADFELQLDKVAVVSRASSDELDKLRAAAEEAGATTKFTATEAAQALEVLARAGKNASESAVLLQDTLNLAAAEGLELAESAAFITQTLAQYNLSVEESARVTDVLVATSQRANTDVRELGAAFNDAGVVASQAGLSLEETAAAIGVLSNAGIQGQKAGVALRNIISQLADPSTKSRKELAKLGIESDNLITVLKGLGAQGDDAKEALLSFGLIPAAAIRTLTKEAGNIDVLAESIGQAGGAAEDAAKAMGDNLIGAATGLGSAWDALRRTLVDPLIEPLTAQIKAFTSTLRQAADSDSIGFFQERIKNLALGTLEAIKTLATGFTVAFTSISAVFNAIAIGFNAVQVAAFRTSAALESISTLSAQRRLEDLLRLLPKLEQEFGKNSIEARTAGAEISTLNIQLANSAGRIKDFQAKAGEAGNAITQNSEDIRQAFLLLFKTLDNETNDATVNLDKFKNSANELKDVVPAGDLDKNLVEPLQTVGEASGVAADNVESLSGALNKLSATGPSPAVSKLAGELRQAAQATTDTANATETLTTATTQNTTATDSNAKAQVKVTGAVKGSIVVLGAIVKNWSEWSAELKEWARTIFNIQGLIPTSLLGAWFERLEQGRKIVEDSIATLEDWRAQLSSAAIQELPEIIDQAERAKATLNVLSETRLDTLNQSIQEARDKLRGFADEIENELFRLTATEEEREIRRFEEQIERIKAIREIDKRRARELEKQAREYHENELSRIRERIEKRDEEANASIAAAGGGSSPLGTNTGITGFGGGSNIVPGITGGQFISGDGQVPVNTINGGPQTTVVLNMLVADRNNLQDLSRLVDKELQKIGRLRQ